MAETLPMEILTDIFTRFLFNSKLNNFKKLIVLRRTCKKWNEVILKCIFDELSKQNHKSWEITIGVSGNNPYKLHKYVAELHSFDQISQTFNFNFLQQTTSIKPEQDIKVKFQYLDYYPFLYTCTLCKPCILKEFINDVGDQKEFSVILNENEMRLELLKIKAKVFWEKVYHIFDDKTFVEVRKSSSYVNYGDPYFDICQDSHRDFK